MSDNGGQEFGRISQSLDDIKSDVKEIKSDIKTGIFPRINTLEINQAKLFTWAAVIAGIAALAARVVF